MSVHSSSVLRRDAMEAIFAYSNPLVPRIGWLVSIGAAIGISESFVVLAVWWSLVVSAICLLNGFFSRESALAAAFLHLCVVNSSGALGYGVDTMTTTALFYLAVGPLPDKWSFDRIWRRIDSKLPSLLGFFRRALQLHLCIIYLAGGIAKAKGCSWWTGEALWRALLRPPFNNLPSDFVVYLAPALPIAGVVVIVLELCYVFAIWYRPTRWLSLGAIVAMHVAIGFAMGLYQFAWMMITLNLAAFGSRRLVRLPGPARGH